MVPVDIGVAADELLADLAVALDLSDEERGCAAHADDRGQLDLRLNRLLDLGREQLVADAGSDSDSRNQHEQIDNVDQTEQLALFIDDFHKLPPLVSFSDIHTVYRAIIP